MTSTDTNKPAGTGDAGLQQQSPKQQQQQKQEYEFHPIANVFPLMSGDEFKRFKEDIQTRKQQEPIWLYEGKILDGRNRYLACKELSRNIQVEEYVGDDPVGFVLSTNLHRRHLNETQRGMVAAKLASLKVGANQHTREGLSIGRASKLSTASETTANKCKKVLNDGVPELVQMIEKGQVAASLAEAVAKLPREKQAELVKMEASAFKKAAKQAMPREETPEGLSDAIDKLLDAVIDKLKKLRAKKPENVEATVADLIRRVKAA